MASAQKGLALAVGPPADKLAKGSESHDEQNHHPNRKGKSSESPVGDLLRRNIGGFTETI
jgi:hypothetical protein